MSPMHPDTSDACAIKDVLCNGSNEACNLQKHDQQAGQCIEAVLVAEDG